MQTFYLVMLFVSYGSATHFFKAIENLHHVPHHKTHVKEVIPVHYPSVPLHSLKKPFPPPVFPIFPVKPIHKHHDKKPKSVAPPIVKPVPVPVPVLVPVKIPPPHKHHVPIDITLKPFIPFAKVHQKIKGHEHIDERYFH
ncbi:proline-rich protein 4-like [Harmonia axyridis]|uniref:proline-rich protein 4-like n=1 Tax=Harmonia axyridis TaxID=115357 RepID=UPI001E2798F8|nr:proline-rich protein 4-like [Harmonia axyridis]